MKIIDVEIKKGILGRADTPIPGIQYCNGWRDFENMGIAVVCTFDLVTRLTRVFLEDDLEALKEHIGTGPTAGFNTRGFDLPLLAHHGVHVDESQHFDALWRIWQAQGLDPQRFGNDHAGWSLDNIMRSTFGLSKSGHGAMAPVWWQQGHHGRVIDYCARDVWLEAKLVEHLIAGLPVFKEPPKGAVRLGAA